MTQRVLVYARQSVEKEGGARSLSIDSQIATLHARCESEGWSVVAEVRESGLRGWMDSDERPGLAEALARAEARDYDTLLVWDMSRLARSVRLQEQWVWQLARFGVQVVSHTEPHAVDAFMRQILGAVAEQRSKEIAANVRRALRERMARGLQHGNIAWGYRQMDAASPLSIDPGPAAHIAWMYAARLDGMGPAAIARDLSRRGVPTPTGLGDWRVCTVSRLLRCATYRGAIRCGEGFLEDAHPAIVTPAAWHAVQALHQRTHRSPRANKQVTSWLEGRIEHGCGLPMYLMQPHGTHQAYVRCRNGVAGIPSVNQPACPVLPRRMLLPLAEARAWDAILTALTQVARVDPMRAMRAAEARYRAQAPTADGERREAAARRRRAQERRHRAEELYLSGARDRTWFAAEDARLGAEIAAVDALLAALPAPPDHDAVTRAYRELRALGDVWSVAVEPADRAALLRRLGVIVVGNETVTLRFRPEYAVFGWSGAP